MHVAPVIMRPVMETRTAAAVLLTAIAVAAQALAPATVDIQPLEVEAL